MVSTQLSKFDGFKQRIDSELLSNHIIHHNKYCEWFAEADLTVDHVKYFTRQFSVFSNQFLVAQLHKVINSANLEEMRAAKEILANELGVVFRSSKKTEDLEVDPEVVSAEGTVDGGTFRFKAAHFEWLLNFAKPLGMGFDDLGKRKNGSPHTLFFCDELIRLFGSDDFNAAAGASFAVENWAAAGFWKQLIKGLERFNNMAETQLNLGFFKWHDKLEDQHAAHTHDELEELYVGPLPFDEDKFITSGNEMLDGVAVFWEGLNLERIARRR